MSSDERAAELIDNLRHQLLSKDREIRNLQTSLRDARMTGIAVGVLLARTPGWTEQDAIDAWNSACDRLTRDGNTTALASFVVQTGKLPGEGVTARA